MNSILHFFSDLPVLIQTIGLIGVFLIIFAESGLLVGFFLPGDSLLFTAGFLASQHIGSLNIITLIPVAFIAAVIGDNVGYAFGKKVGPRIFKQEKSFFFKKEYVTKSQVFYEKYGVLTIVLSRFTPIVRTFAPIMAGVGGMNYRTFFFYNVLGGAFWVSSVTLAGYFLGRIIPNIDHYLLPVIGLIILLSLAPSIYHLIKNKNN